MNSSPTVADGLVFVGSGDSTLYTVDGQTGELASEEPFETEDAIYSSPTVVDGASDDSRINAGTLGHHHGVK